MSELLQEPDLLQEYVDSGHQRLRVDRGAGIIRGVKLLGLRSKNGRRYQEAALADAVGLYEGAKVNINHPKGHPLSPRDYQDRLGIIRGVELRANEGLFGDLHFNPKHALSEQLMWDAEHASQNVGLSHNVLARTSRQGNETVVEAITRVQSIDLVADPATTRGLFEQEATPPAIPWDALTIDELKIHRPDLLQEVEQLQIAELENAQRQLDAATARAATISRRERIVQLLIEHKLPIPGSRHESARRIVSDQFVETLLAASDEVTLRELIAERAALVRSAHRWQCDADQPPTRPIARDQLAAAHRAGGSVRNAQEFAAAISGH